MRRFLGAGALGLVALLGCADGSETDEPLVFEQAMGGAVPLVATLTTNANWHNGYCASVTLRNSSANLATQSWRLELDLGGATLASRWSGEYRGSTGRLVVNSLSWNSRIAPNGEVILGFCATKSLITDRPFLVSAEGVLAIGGGVGGRDSGSASGGANSGEPSRGELAGGASSGTAGDSGVMAGGSSPSSESESSTLEFRSSSGIGPDGCSDVEATEVAIKEVSLYQTVKIPIMSDGVRIPASSRVAPIVAGKDGLLRVAVHLSDAWRTREMAARVVLTQGNHRLATHWMRQTITGGYFESDSSTSFQVLLEGTAISPETRYSVEIVECGSASGTKLRPRYPETGGELLGAEALGPLKIVVVPFIANGVLADTSPLALQSAADLLVELYPVSQVSVTVSSPVAALEPPIAGGRNERDSWGKLLDQVREKRALDNPDPDVYYVGWVRPAVSRAVYSGTSGYLSGLGYVVTDVNDARSRASVVLNWGDRVSAEDMAHELGHNHGRGHAPCGAISPDAEYPYASAALGSWGWDAQTDAWIDPSSAHDIMSYCAPKWVSDYTYRGLADRVRNVNALASSGLQSATGTIASAAASQMLWSHRVWHVLVENSSGLKWSTPLSANRYGGGIAVTGDVLGFDGQWLSQVTLYKTVAVDGERQVTATYLVPDPEPGWAALRVNGHQLSFASAVGMNAQR